MIGLAFKRWILLFCDFTLPVENLCLCHAVYTNLQIFDNTSWYVVSL